MKKQRKHYTPEEKVAILRRHLLEGVPISDLCDELGLQPTVSYRWQKEFFENGAAAFQQRRRTNRQPEQERIAYLENKIQTKDEVLAELMAEHVALKKSWGTLTGVWVPHDTRDQIVDLGKVNEHNGWVPRGFWLEDWEKQAIIAFHLKNPLGGYRRLTFIMLDADIVAVSPASVC
jgi:transposase